MIQLKRFFIKFIEWNSWGQFLVSKLQFPLMLVITMKTFDISVKLSIISGLIAYALSVLAGAIWNKHFKNDFNKEFYKGIK